MTTLVCYTYATWRAHGGYDKYLITNDPESLRDMIDEKIFNTSIYDYKMYIYHYNGNVLFGIKTVNLICEERLELAIAAFKEYRYAEKPSCDYYLNVRYGVDRFDGCDQCDIATTPIETNEDQISIKINRLEKIL